MALNQQIRAVSRLVHVPGGFFAARPVLVRSASGRAAKKPPARNDHSVHYPEIRCNAYAKEQHLIYLDFHTALADEHRGLKATYGDDGVHPNLAGYRAMEPLLNQAVAAALRPK